MEIRPGGLGITEVPFFLRKKQYSEYALYLLGESLYKSGEYKKALEKYEQFAKKYKDSKLIDDVYYSSGYAAEAMILRSLHSHIFKKYMKAPKSDLRPRRHLQMREDIRGEKGPPGRKKTL